MREDVEKAIILSARIHEQDKWGVYPYSSFLALVVSNVSPESEGVAWLSGVRSKHPKMKRTIKTYLPEYERTLEVLEYEEGTPLSHRVSKVLQSGDEVAREVLASILDVELRFSNDVRLNTDHHEEALRRLTKTERY